MSLVTCHNSVTSRVTQPNCRDASHVTQPNCTGCHLSLVTTQSHHMSPNPTAQDVTCHLSQPSHITCHPTQLQGCVTCYPTHRSVAVFPSLYKTCYTRGSHTEPTEVRWQEQWMTPVYPHFDTLNTTTPKAFCIPAANKLGACHVTLCTSFQLSQCPHATHR